jgi:hypothetical protein
MERFINRQNIGRYRRLASETTNATERQQILRLLAEEEAKFKLDQAVGDHGKARQPQARNKLTESEGTR